MHVFISFIRIKELSHKNREVLTDFSSKNAYNLLKYCLSMYIFFLSYVDYPFLHEENEGQNVSHENAPKNT